MSLLRHPDVFAAASASSPVTAWYHYDTVYTERYMWIPEENKGGYEAGSAMTYAKDLKGRLMLYYGTADNNVHPSNMMQLISELQKAGKSFDLQVGPDRGHSGINADRMMEFFIENLIMKPAPGVPTSEGSGLRAQGSGLRAQGSRLVSQYFQRFTSAAVCKPQTGSRPVQIARNPTPHMGRLKFRLGCIHPFGAEKCAECDTFPARHSI
jgi:hypothetical protein